MVLKARRKLADGIFGQYALSVKRADGFRKEKPLNLDILAGSVSGVLQVARASKIEIGRVVLNTLTVIFWYQHLIIRELQNKAMSVSISSFGSKLMVSHCPKAGSFITIMVSKMITDLIIFWLCLIRNTSFLLVLYRKEFLNLKLS